MDLKNMTEMDLLSLRAEINQELKNYENRNKTKVYTVSIEFDGTKYFLKKDNAIQWLKDIIDYEAVFDGNEIKCHETYLNDAEVKNYCQDYEIDAIPTEDWGAHQAHCSIEHGCKYGDEDCPVVLKKI